MDVTDLPVPLSRIETLWNCLITGETPDFEPLSRNEKYLMAMLDRYDISNLPAPMSRGEKLLYKIAVGETDLSDVPGYLSRYEELLKYLIENGGISGGDFEYVLYTLNQSLSTLYTTAEKPVKSAILKGQTLVNLSPFTSKIALSLSNNVSEHKKLSQPLNQNTKYILIFNINNSTSSLASDYIMVRGYNTDGAFKEYGRTIKNFGNGRHYILLESTEGNVDRIFIASNFSCEIDDTILAIYQDGMENWDIPYFTGMQSVKMPVLKTTGKNLIPLKEDWVQGQIINGGGISVNSYALRTKSKIKVKPNTKYTFSRKSSDCKIAYHEWEANGKYIKDSGWITAFPYTFTTNNKTEYINLTTRRVSNVDSTVDNLDDTLIWQLEESSTATTYEPHKSNILHTPSDLELRGIGDVQDELVLETGKLTQRIGEDIFDGSSDEVITIFNNTFTNVIWFKLLLSNNTTQANSVMCDRFKTDSAWGDYEEIQNHANSNNLFVGIKRDRLDTEDVNGFKTWLSQNPVTVQYQLETESIKTVDLTVVDQDNQPAKLGTFENITHVSLESAGLIPEVEMEVATNLLEDTVFNLTDAFNTLYPTAAKPVVDGTLYGQTLVNVALKEYMEPVNNASINGETITLDLSQQYSRLEFSKDNSLLIPNEVYTCILYDVVGDITNVNFSSQNENSVKIYLKDVGYKFTFTMGVGKNGTNRLCYIENKTATSGTVSFKIVLLKGEYTNVDIPYFTGMQSVKMPVLTTTGKNLFYSALEYGDFNNSTGIPNNTSPSIIRTKEYNKIPSNKTCCLTIFNGIADTSTFIVHEYDNNFNYIKSTTDSKNIFTTSANTKYVKFRFRKSNSAPYTNEELSALSCMITEGSAIPTAYEPYKSNILSTPSDLELRKVGEVQDELNVMTGEVVERVKEIALNGSEDWKEYTTNTTNTYCGVLRDAIISDYKGTIYLDDKLTQLSDSDVDSEGIRINSGKRIFVRLNRNKGVTDLVTFKQYLSQNPITVQYETTTPTTKTVDLSVVNQDGNETKLRTFDDTTHVLLNSEGLIPTASLTVRTKIPSGSSTSLLMDDISTEQQQLETAVDEQSNNVDATMVATTEIYEETL